MNLEDDIKYVIIQQIKNCPLTIKTTQELAVTYSNLALNLTHNEQVSTGNHKLNWHKYIWMWCILSDP